MIKVKTVWLLQTYEVDAYYNKTNTKYIGLFNTKEEAKDYVLTILSEEFFIWNCSVTKLENIVDCTN